MPQKTPTVTFKNIRREASGDDTPNVQWYEMTTKQLFGDENPFYFHYLARSHQFVQRFSFHCLIAFIPISPI